VLLVNPDDRAATSISRWYRIVPVFRELTTPF